MHITFHCMWVLLSWSSEIFDFELKHRSDALILHGSSAIFYLKHRSDALILHGSIPKSYDCMCYLMVWLWIYTKPLESTVMHIAAGYKILKDISWLLWSMHNTKELVHQSYKMPDNLSQAGIEVYCFCLYLSGP